jgi:xanthine dehydrogenase accessory factor
MDLVAQMKAAEQAFALATVVRTVSVTAAKAGAKAIIRPDGTIVAGWIGGGCARGAVLKAAREALADGEPRMVSVQPEQMLAELGVKPGDNRDGIRFASNMCPSKGTMDIFVEPVLPHPSLVIFGASPVAMSLASQARQLGYHVTLAAPASDLSVVADADVLIDGFVLGQLHQAKRFIVVSTQGRGDEVALRAALSVDAGYHAFVGSRRKMAALREKLIVAGVAPDTVDRVRAPAGLDLGAITPEEIAMSILAEITVERRRGQRDSVSLPSSQGPHMQMNDSQRIPAPKEKVWTALNDPAVLKQCIPGCQSLEMSTPNEMTATVVIKVGPVKATFGGKVILSDLDPPNSYRITGEGSGGIAGFAKGGATVRLESEGADVTILHYEVDAQIGGKLAQLGGRLIDSTSKKLAGEFFTSFGEVVGKAEVA